MKTGRRRMSDKSRRTVRYILLVPVFLFVIPFICNPQDLNPLLLAAAYALLVFPAAILSAIDISRSDKVQGAAEPVQTPGPAIPETDGKVKFHDVHGKLKLSVDAPAVMFISAEDNYVNVNYLDAGRVSCCQIRNTMNAIEPAAVSAGLIRCHRSHYINPKYVTVLQKDGNGGIEAEFVRPDVEPVPVSRKYYEQVSHILDRK